ncbi:MAG TPA: lysophospholipid acyltransferase family protein [Gemmataceae bacterium]|nr:lysophospholipid acyltransferase family protein [Gemmataceae bacterium]
MSKSRSFVADYTVYLIVRLFVSVIQVLTIDGSIAFADVLAWLAYRVDRRHRAVALENLRIAFGDRFSSAERDDLVRSVYLHFCRLLIEIIHLPRRMHITNWRDHLDLSTARPFIACLLSDRPLLIVTGHFGNWEMGSYALGLLGFPCHAVARPLDNPYLDDFLRQFRERTGQKLLAKKGDFEQMQQILSGRGVLGTLADQDAGKRGLFVDFFGRPASTHKAIALLALQYRVPLIVLLTRNLGKPLHCRVEVEDLILPEHYEGQPDAVRAVTQRFTAALERGVSRAPAQYFWLHRRWKHEPTRSSRRAA